MSTQAQSHEAPAIIAWGMDARAFGGARECGDLAVVVASTAGMVVAVADGLGHGREAETAAKAAADLIERRADESVTDLMKHCHEGLRSTRGVALSIASFDTQTCTMAWLGVGNVEGVLVRADATARPERHSLLLRGGVVGYRMPSLRAEVLQVFPGDTLILATDGINSRFDHESTHGRPPQELARHILLRHGKDTDDALVLVARYLGAPT